jgi:hypothetical protein
MSRIEAALRRATRVHDDASNETIRHIGRCSRDAAICAIVAEIERLDDESRAFVLHAVIERYDLLPASPDDHKREPVAPMIRGFVEAFQQLAREWNGE